MKQDGIYSFTIVIFTDFCLSSVYLMQQEGEFDVFRYKFEKMNIGIIYNNRYKKIYSI